MGTSAWPRLNALRAPDNPLLWALQGYLDPREEGPFSSLAKQLVVGHEEYRQIMHREPHFRRAFAEVYRSRVLLFLGSGLKESYFVDLFGEVLETLGTIGHFHYALVPRGSVDSDFLARRLQIRAIEFDPGENYKDIGPRVADFITRLGQYVAKQRPLTTSWPVRRQAEGWDRPGAVPNVVLVRGVLPKELRDGTATALSVGSDSNYFYPSQVAAEVLIAAGVDDLDTVTHLESRKLSYCLPSNHSLLEPVAASKYLQKVKDLSLYLVNARDLESGGKDVRDARAVMFATRDLVLAAAESGLGTINATLLATSPTEKKFPSYIALASMLRGYAKACRDRGKGSAPQLQIFIIDPQVLALLETGRLDPAALLEDEEVQFWTELHEGNDLATAALHAESQDRSLREFLGGMQLPSKLWTWQVLPPPRGGVKPQLVSDLEDKVTLEAAGLLSGSRLVLRRAGSGGGS